MQGLERDAGRPEGDDEERATRHEGQVPGLRDGALSDPQAIALRTSRQVVLAMAQAALEVKAEELLVLDLRKLSFSFDFFLLCNAASGRRIQTVAETIQEKLSEREVNSVHREGQPESGWLLLDFGSVIAHIFSPEARQFYRLERLWADAPRVRIPKQ